MKIYKYEMSEADHIDLAKALNSVNGMVFLSGYESDLYDHMYPDWLVLKKKTRCDSNAIRTEYLYISPNARYGTNQGKLFDD